MTQKETLKERFDARGFAVNQYARAHKLDNGDLSRILSGKRKGVRGMGRKIVKQLAKDGVWVGKFPWEIDSEKAS